MTEQTNYPPNPPRGCGKKRPGFYLEGTLGATGSLAAITWILGTHVQGSINCLTKIPARQMQIGNLAASLQAGEFVSLDVQFLQGLGQSTEDEAARLGYARLAKVAGTAALFDHVGSDNYTPAEFADELAELGPSRRVPKQMALQMAQAVAEYGAMPIVFTHSDLPLFPDLATRDRVLDLAAQAVYMFDPEALYTIPTWQRAGWGMFADSQDRGWDHYMVQTLQAMARIRRQPSLVTGTTAEAWRPLAETLASVPTVEAPFCASWITKVTYVTEGNEAPDIYNGMTKRGIDILDLSDPANQ